MDDRSLKDRVVLVTGASRGIGREIAVRVAADGAKVALLAKTDAPHPKITGTLPDEQVLRAEGVDDFSGFRLAAREEDLTPNFYLPAAPLPTR